MNRNQCLRRGAKDALPIALGYFAVAFAIGIAAKQAGLNVWEAAGLSLLNVTSAGEAAGISLLAQGTGWLELAVTQFVINSRYLLMSCALSQKCPPALSLPHRLLISHGITDEIFAIASAFPGTLSPYYVYGAMAVSIPAWTLGTVCGLLFGNILPSRIVRALGVALYGMFLAIILPPARKNHVLAALILLSAGLSWLFSVLPLLREISPGFRILLLTVLLAGGAAVLFPVKETDSSQDSDRKSDLETKEVQP